MLRKISENFKKYFGSFKKYYRNVLELVWKFSKKFQKILRIIAENLKNYFIKLSDSLLSVKWRSAVFRTSNGRLTLVQ